MLNLIGQEPLENVMMIINDVERAKVLTEKARITPETTAEAIIKLMSQSRYSFQISLRPNVGQEISIPIGKDQNEIDLQISIHQSNGVVEETIKIFKLQITEGKEG
ncbi:MAG: hypothetical protein KF763_06750 [Cyclobacteriaceae bacterium]|nr:hypothetical protein [Cyclobacteriaceae bacterium]